MIYIVLEHLLNNVNQPNLAHWITTKLFEDSKESGYVEMPRHFYASLEDAKVLFWRQSSESRINCSKGFVQLDVSLLKNTNVDTIQHFKQSMKDNKFTFDEIQNAIVGIHVNSKFIPRQYLDRKNKEIEHLKNLEYLFDDKQLQLTESYANYLARMPADLQYLFFVDFALFDYQGENWIPYAMREPGCMADLFITQAKSLNYINSAQTTSEITLDHVVDLQKSLSANVFALEKNSRSGLFRDGFNTFQILQDAATFDGILEILKRIKNDNNQNGFMIGYFKKSNIISKFLMEIYNGKDKNDAINHVVKETLQFFNLQADGEEITEEINQILDSFLKEFNVKIKMGSHSLYLLASKTRNSLLQLEYAFDLKYSRQGAIARHNTLHHLSDHELIEFAKNIMDMINKGEKVYHFSPDKDLALEMIKEALMNYNHNIKKFKLPNDIITCILELVHELEILHLFYDVNCRTSYFLLNQLLVLNGIKPAILYNPNRLDAYSINELVEQVKQGIFRYQFIIDHQEQFSEENSSRNKYFARYYYDIIKDEHFDEFIGIYRQMNQALLNQIMKHQQSPMQFSQTSNLFAFFQDQNETTNLHARTENLELNRSPGRLMNHVST